MPLVAAHAARTSTCPSLLAPPTTLPTATANVAVDPFACSSKRAK
jgi:hypothetical protein